MCSPRSTSRLHAKLESPDWGLVKRSDERDMNLITTKVRTFYLNMDVRTVQAQSCTNVHVVPIPCASRTRLCRTPIHLEMNQTRTLLIKLNFTRCSADTLHCRLAMLRVHTSES